MDEQLRRRRLLPSPLQQLNINLNPLGSSRDHSPAKVAENILNNTNRTKYFSLLVSLLKDHRRTNNNRIGKSVSKLALINYLNIILLLFLSFGTNIIIVNSEPMPQPVPVRISSSYSKSPRYSDTHNYHNSNSTIITSTSTSNSTSNVNNNSNNNANRTISSKNFSTHQMTSINRPFYTKITSDDAVAKPSNFINSFRATTTTTKKPKRSSKPKLSVPFIPSSTTENFFNLHIGNNNNNTGSSTSFLSSDSGPKIRLEPFFNLLTNFQSLALGTSKEQKFSPSYQTITQSMNENTKKSRAKGTKGMRQKKRNRNKNNKVNGPIPIPIPKPLIDPEELTSESKKIIVHPLDVLRLNIPTGSGSLETEALPTAESLKSLESITKPNHWPYKTTQRSGDRNKDIGLDKFNKTSQEGPESRERRLRSEFFENFHDKDIELQADETVIDPQNDAVDEHSEDQMHPPTTSHSSTGGSNVNIPPGYTLQTNIQAAPGSEYHFTDTAKGSNQPGNQQQGQPPYYSTIYSAANSNKQDIEMISKYPVSFSYNPVKNNHNHPNGPHQPPPPHRQQHSHPYPIPIPYPKSKRRPNLHSYYDPHYHNYAAYGENNQQYGPSYSSGYGNHPSGFNNYGSHYVGNTLPNGPPPPLPQRPDQGQQQSNNNPPNPISELQPETSSSDISQHDTSLDTSQNFETDNSVANSNQKIGVMGSFDLFYKEYKLLTWAAFLVVTSLAVLGLLVFLYLNNPPTEVVQARSGFSIENLLENQQIMKFLSSLMENNTTGPKKRKRYKKETLQRRDPGSLAEQILSAINKKDL